MNSSEEQKFRPLSPLGRLKEKWRALDKTERDYWRKQFVSSRTILSLRQEIAFKLGVSLIHDVDLFRFTDWVAEEDKRQAKVERFETDAAKLILSSCSSSAGAPASAELRQLYRQCLRDLERSAFRALLGPGHSESLRKYAHKNVEDFYLDVLCLCVFALIEESTPRHGLN